MPSDFTLIEKQLSLVIVGGFHPLNFTKDWLKVNGLMNEEDFSESTTGLHSPMHVETVLPWVNVQVTPYSNDKNKLSIVLTDSAMYAQFKDFVNSICSMYSTTVVTAMGINFLFITKHKDQDSWDALGYRILPPEQFQNYFASGLESTRLGMNNASMKIEHILDSVISLEDNDLRTELNINVKPIYYNQAGERIEFSTEIGLNYHFPITLEAGMDGVSETIHTYIDFLNETVDDKVLALVTGDLR